MSRIRYALVRALAKRPNHGRALAQLLSSNQTTIARTTHDLESMNVIEHELHGRNKVYSLKDSIEARSMLVMAEHDALIELLERVPMLRRIIERIQAHDALAILFGSYAKGTQRAGSDIDLYLETDDRTVRDAIKRIDSRLHVIIGSFEESPLRSEIEENHVIICGAERYEALTRSARTRG
ncbi:MAG: nucleotidyltransferase domain-containing protein [Candidatus Woesearchaeota archaeon]